MTLIETMKSLESLGTAQNRKVYARHGVRQNQFGVSFAHLTKLAKKIGTDQALAEALMRTGNHDASVLATMVADADSMSPRDLETWVKGVDNYILADLFARNVASKSSFARQKADTWTGSKKDFVGQTGWVVVALLAMNNGDMPDGYFASRLAEIEERIHSAPNRTRHAMNSALMAIGIYRPRLRKAALEAAARIGKVEVDHGETGCKTPDATAYIRKAVARQSGPSAPKRDASAKATRRPR